MTETVVLGESGRLYFRRLSGKNLDWSQGNVSQYSPTAAKFES